MAAVYQEILTPNHKTGLWDGAPLRVVLSQRTGELWSLCMGLESIVNRWLTAPVGVIHQTGWGELWHYWDDIRLADGYADRWYQAAQSAGGVIVTMRQGPQAPPSTQLQAWVPAGQVLVRDSAGRPWPVPD